MSESAPEAAESTPVEKPGPSAQEPQAEAPAAEESTTFDAAYVKKLRAEAAKYRNELKEAQAKASKFDEYEQSQKSELQKATERAEAAEKALDAAKIEALRSKVAASKGLPSSIADRLRGNTVEEMEADADAMLEELSKKYVAKSAPSREATGAGVAGKPQDFDSMSPQELVAAMKASGRSGQARIS